VKLEKQRFLRAQCCHYSHVKQLLFLNLVSMIIGKDMFKVINIICIFILFITLFRPSHLSEYRSQKIISFIIWFSALLFTNAFGYDFTDKYITADKFLWNTKGGSSDLFFFFWYWGLNSGPHRKSSGTWAAPLSLDSSFNDW
jgi:hypothetical protein